MLNISRLGTLRIGRHLVIRSGLYNGVDSKITKIIIGGRATLEIGDNVGISNAIIACMFHIKIGNNVNIGFGSTIIDSDFHSIDPQSRLSKDDCIKAKKGEVIVHDNVLIGAHSIILKGVIIGCNSVVAAGSVVCTNIPSNEVWGGNPAKFLKHI